MAALWDSHKVVVCVGTGGVGKTTVSASLAIAAAAAGKSTLVMTIDPARRLANALGISDFGNVEKEVTAAQLKPYGVTLKAPLWVMMLDVQRTFDELIRNLSNDPARRQQIMRNPIYQQFSTVLSGALEYAAVEKLYEVYASKRYDVIILDTPPSQNAIDFLEAPSKMLDFLNQGLVQRLTKPSAAAGRWSLKLLNMGANFISKTLGTMAGSDTLRDLSEFLGGLSDLYEGFGQRYDAVLKLLNSDELGFVLVTTARANQRAAMRRFQEDLKNSGFKTRAIVANRVRPPCGPMQAERTEFVKRLSELSESEAAIVQTALDEEERLSDLDQQALRELVAEMEDLTLITLPELPPNIHDIGALAHLYRAFFALPSS